MNYGEIFNCDVANGPGMRVTLFVSGCPHHCPGCFNEETWDYAYGKPFTNETVSHILEMLAPSHIQGLTLLGGEPMAPQNQPDVHWLLQAVREKYGTSKDIWIYSGYTFEELTGKTDNIPVRTNHTPAILDLADVLVDGRFVLDQKDITLKFRGSKNQRILDLAKSIANGTPVWLSQYR